MYLLTKNILPFKLRVNKNRFKVEKYIVGGFFFKVRRVHTKI